MLLSFAVVLALSVAAAAATTVASPPALPAPLHIESTLTISASVVSATYTDKTWLSTAGFKSVGNFSGIALAGVAAYWSDIAASVSSNTLYTYTSTSSCKSTTGGITATNQTHYRIGVLYYSSCTSWTEAVGSNVTGYSYLIDAYTGTNCSILSVVSGSTVVLYFKTGTNTAVGGSGSGTYPYSGVNIAFTVTITISTWDTSSVSSSAIAPNSACSNVAESSSSASVKASSTVASSTTDVSSSAKAASSSTKAASSSTKAASSSTKAASSSTKAASSTTASSATQGSAARTVAKWAVGAFAVLAVMF